MTKMNPYKGFEIIVDEDGKFEGMKDEPQEDGKVAHISFNSESLAGLKKKIDLYEKSKVKRQPAIHVGYDGEVREVVITSISEEEHQGSYTRHTRHEAWITYKDEDGDNRREKVHIDSLFKPTDENKKLVIEIKNLDKQREELEKKMDDLKEKLKPNFKVADFGYKEQE